MSTRFAWLPAAIQFLGVALLVCEALGQTHVTDNTMSLEKGSPSPPATLANFGWIAGHWAGTAMGGTFEETWNAPKGDSMIGVFKFLKNDKVEFCELLTIVPSGDSVVLRLKHFDAQLRGWEAKDDAVEFPLVKVTDHEAYFDGLTFRKTGADRLQIFVVFHKQGKPDKEVEFAAELVSSPHKAVGGH